MQPVVVGGIGVLVGGTGVLVGGMGVEVGAGAAAQVFPLEHDEPLPVHTWPLPQLESLAQQLLVPLFHLHVPFMQVRLSWQADWLEQDWFTPTLFWQFL